MDLDEPPLQAEIMMRSSMTLSLMLHAVSGMAGAGRKEADLRAAPALNDEDILVTNGRLL